MFADLRASAPPRLSVGSAAIVSIAISSLLFSHSAADAQCAYQWRQTAGVTGGVPTIYAQCLWDPDGPGPQSVGLVVAGTFTNAGPIPANNIAFWNGTTWAALGAGIDGSVFSLAVLPNNNLVAAGTFPTAGGVTVNNIAQWTGTNWAPVGPGPTFGTNNTINSISVRPNGDLVAGGIFSTMNGVSMTRLSRWNGTAWTSIGSPNQAVWAVLALPTGDVIIGGQFTQGGGIIGGKASRWNGTSWAAMGALNSTVLSLGTNSDGDVIAGGQFTAAGSVMLNHIARWTGAAWTGIGSGFNGTIWTVQPMPNGDLLAGGVFLQLANGQFINSIAAWNGSAWYQLGPGLDLKPGGIAPFIGAITRMPSGEMMVGGEFPGFSNVSSPNLAAWAPPAGPAFTIQPQPQNPCPLTDATFSVAANGNGMPAYAWQAELDPGVWTYLFDGDLVHNGIIIGSVTNSTNSSMKISSLAHFHDDRMLLNIRAAATDACGTSLSNVAALTVSPTSATGDANADGLTDADDIAPLVTYILTGAPQGSGICSCDFDGNSAVDGSDLPGFVSYLLTH